MGGGCGETGSELGKSGNTGPRRLGGGEVPLSLGTKNWVLGGNKIYDSGEGRAGGMGGGRFSAESGKQISRKRYGEVS